MGALQAEKVAKSNVLDVGQRSASFESGDNFGMHRFRSAEEASGAVKESVLELNAAGNLITARLKHVPLRTPHYTPPRCRAAAAPLPHGCLLTRRS